MQWNPVAQITVQRHAELGDRKIGLLCREHSVLHVCRFVLLVVPIAPKSCGYKAAI